MEEKEEKEVEEEKRGGMELGLVRLDLTYYWSSLSRVGRVDSDSAEF